MGVDEKEDWYYLGCEECNRKVEITLVIEEAEDGAEEAKFKQVLICSNPDCPKEVVSATPVFRIPIRVQDSAAIASLTLFDRGAKKMLGMTAIQLLEKSKQGQLVNDQAIFESLEKRIPADQGADEPVCDVSLSDLSTQNVFGLKEHVDSIGDSFTPECTSKDCSKTSSIEWKRNLSEAYEVDDSTSLSSTKIKKTGVANVSTDDEETILLVPKIEK